jgi:hypothetical protein
LISHGGDDRFQLDPERIKRARYWLTVMIAVMTDQRRLANEDEKGHEHLGKVVDLDFDGHGDGQEGGKQNPSMTPKRSWTGEWSQFPSLIFIIQEMASAVHE